MPDDSDDLQALRAIARRIGPEPGRTAWEDPTAGLWDRIAAEAGVAPSPVATVTSLPAPAERARRRRPVAWVVAGAAAVLVLVFGSLLYVNRPDSAEVVASTSLERLGPSGTGDAELLDDRGRLSLRVDTAGLDAGDGFLEVWVIDPDVTKLVSLGPLRPDGTYDLPPGLDPAEFPIVDVSIEPMDGNPTHSGDSVLRGQLEF